MLWRLLWPLAVLFVVDALDPVAVDSRSDGCETAEVGDCDAAACGGQCEGRYARYKVHLVIENVVVDRTSKSCQCLAEPICGIVGMDINSGCRTYRHLPHEGQKVVRRWTMRGEQWTAEADAVRHRLLLISSMNTRFCCRVAVAATATGSLLIVTNHITLTFSTKASETERDGSDSVLSATTNS
uniref:Uncharacterized protein n=1 Tax=Plectus sambesii TaxID=2011161 RepID=A0A914VWD4_9BILA